MYGVIYMDGHFLPYYGMYPIIKGWHGVRRIPMKGSYNFIGVDDKFTPWIFLIRSTANGKARRSLRSLLQLLFFSVVFVSDVLLSSSLVSWPFVQCF